MVINYVPTTGTCIEKKVSKMFYNATYLQGGCGAGVSYEHVSTVGKIKLDTPRHTQNTHYCIVQGMCSVLTSTIHRVT